MLFTFAGSNCSSSSEGESIPTALHAGICVRQQSVSIKDAIIAREALSLLVTCLQLRCQQLCKSERHKRISFYLFKMYYRQWCLILYLISPGSFYNLPSVNDFIIDILLGSPSEEVKKKKKKKRIFLHIGFQSTLPRIAVYANTLAFSLRSDVWLVTNCTLSASLTLQLSTNCRNPTCSCSQSFSQLNCLCGVQHLSWEESTRGSHAEAHNKYPFKVLVI